MTMDKNYFNLAIKLNECTMIALAAGKNVLYFETMFGRDPSILEDPTLAEFVNKLHRMNQELPHLLQRAEELRRILEEYNRIAMR